MDIDLRYEGNVLWRLALGEKGGRAEEGVVWRFGVKL